MKDRKPRWYRGPEGDRYRFTITRELREMRERAGFTQEELARRLSSLLGRRINSKQVAVWETGRVNAGSDVYRAYIDACEATPPLAPRGRDDLRAPADQAASLAEAIAALAKAAQRIVPRPNDLISTDEAAEIAGRTRQTINAWIDKGLLPTYLHGRIKKVSRSELVEFLRTRSLQSGGSTSMEGI